MSVEATTVPGADRAEAWALGAPRPSYRLRGVRAVLAERIVENATITVEDGRIEDVTTGASAGPGDRPVIDGQNLLLLPGFVDVHSDALETERTPRPGAEVPIEFAMASFEGRAAAAGTTTMFHGAAFQHQNTRGVARRPDRALDLCGVADTTPSYRVDHRVLHRLDVLSAAGATTLSRRIEALGRHRGGEPPALVSHEDHTPGQGQYADPSGLRRFMIERDGMSPDEADARIGARVRASAALADVRAANLDWLSGLARDGLIRLVGHDPDSPEAVDALAARGGAVAEFPTTLAAAERARDRGLHVVAGAPNVLRGSSHSGNVSARELVSRGVVDALASDYLPTALLAAVTLLARDGIVDLPRAVGLITSGPARVAGLTDRGVIAPGMRADLALVDDTGHWPYAVATLRAGAAT
ncbi:alpha-D-ribose 1-methylphosphonate 5-triphosphate diphosphatase [Georgenia deserti]|uniref:Alpha-D-ribose 1-methylphosphonate 5-triphosphate diphosphatase n=1 Tax=Georgenia deserti TaxID=2093781 RepID=A0ABW4L6G5_9MICO